MATIVFDLDGTLVDSSALVLSSFQYTLGHFGIQVDNSTIEDIRARSTEELFDGYVTDDKKEEAFKRLQHISSQNAKKSTFFQGIEELLISLKKSGYKLAVWTGRDTTSAIEILEHNNYSNFFDIVVGNSCVSKNKPNPEGLEKIANALSSNLEKFVMIGDHYHDIEGAKKFGAKSILALWSYPDANSTYDHFGADFVAKIPSDLLTFIPTLF